MMKRFFSRSCFGLLFLFILGSTVALFVFTIFFQQSQAITSNGTATQMARASATIVVNRSLTLAPVPSITPLTLTFPADDVTVQIDPANTGIPGQLTDTQDLPAPATMNTMEATVTPLPYITSTDAPRNSGTSTYPLTVTAEVMLAQTHVAQYQSNVAATRTAIAAESEIIYATLTARAASKTEGEH